MLPILFTQISLSLIALTHANILDICHKTYDLCNTACDWLHKCDSEPREMCYKCSMVNQGVVAVLVLCALIVLLCLIAITYAMRQSSPPKETHSNVDQTNKAEPPSAST
uniref:Uncharacterized protein n=1 Tax=Romanomermis culicivorax TaxID=13658 RepID=A0A915I5X5_ROMCU